MPSPPDDGAFHGFISYSHAADGKLAPAIQRGLQRFAKPWYRARALHIFRDDAAMSVNSDLWRSIERALDASEHYILLASPRAAASEWVTKEAERWREHKPIDKLLLALTDGNLEWDRTAGDFDWSRSDALPKVLAGAFGRQPRWVDLRWARDETDLSLDHPDFRAAIADLAAPLHGVPKEQLASEEVVQQRRAVRLRRSAVALLVTLTSVALLAGALAMVERASAVSNQKTAQSRQLAAGAEANLSTDPELSLLLGLRAVAVAPTAQATGALRDALPRIQELETLPTGGAAEDAAFDRSAARVLAATTDGAFIWDVRTGHLVGSIAVGTSGANCSTFSWTPRTAAAAQETCGADATTLNDAQFNHEGTEVVTAGSDGVDVWDLTSASSRPVARINATGNREIAQAAFSPDDQRIVTGNQAGMVQIWTRSGAALGGFTEPGGSAVSRVAFSPTGDRVLAVSGDGDVRIWSLTATAPPLVLAEPTGQAITAASFSPNGALVATASLDGTARIWKLEPTPAVTVTSGEVGGSPLSDVAFSLDGSKLVTAADDGTAQVWAASTGVPVTTLAGHSGIVSSAQFNSNGTEVVSAGQDGTVRIWDAAPREQVSHVLEPFGIESFASASFSRSGFDVALVGTDGLVRLLDPENGHVIVLGGQHPVRMGRTFSVNNTLAEVDQGNALSDAAFNFDGSLLVTVGNDSFLRIWDTSTGRQVMSLGGDFSAAGFGQGLFGDALLTIGVTGADAWPLNLGSGLPHGPPVKFATFIGGTGARTQAAFGFPWVATVFGGSEVDAWQVTDGGGPAELTIEVPGSLVYDVAVDGFDVLTAGADGVARIWSFGRFEAEQTQAMHEPGGAALYTAQYSPDGSQIVTASEDGTARIWDVASGQDLTGFTIPGLTSARFTGADEIMTVSTSGAIDVWRTDAAASPSALIGLAERRRTRALTPDERAQYLAGLG